MKSFLKSNLYPIIVFITGACVLIIEVVAVRALSPFFGNTIFTVSSVISVILAALSFGYFYGGKYADKNPSPQAFFKIIMFSGAILLILHIISFFLLPIITIYTSITLGPLIAAVVLYFFPSLLLGTLSPFAVKLHSLQNQEKGIGELTGKMFFYSTFGSISGSLIAGFVLIPNLGIDIIFVSTSLVLFLLGFIPSLILHTEKRLLRNMLLFVTLSASILTALSKATDKLFVYKKDGIYERIVIYDGKLNNRPVRFLQQDRGSSGAAYLDTQDPTQNPYDYPRYYSLYKIFAPHVKDILVIGGGPYSIPKALAAELPNSNITVSEIEPELHKLALKYFALQDSSNIKTVNEDGRRLLALSENKYDYIFSDVYYSLYSIPAHITTQEFFELAKSRLNEDGIFVANVISNLKNAGSELFKAELKTFLSVFPNSYFFAVESPNSNETQNVIFVGYNSSKTISLNSDNVKNHPDEIISKLNEKQIDVSKIDLEKAIVLTDNYAPTDSLSAKLIKETLKSN